MGTAYPALVRRVPFVLTVLFGMIMLVVAATACGDDGGLDTTSVESAEPTFAYVIPAGAGEAFDAGEPLDILPARLEASVGDVIEIRNDDDRGHLIGPFFVGANETLRQEFSSPGEFIGDCTVHPSGQIVVVVT